MSFANIFSSFLIPTSNSFNVPDGFIFNFQHGLLIFTRKQIDDKIYINNIIYNRDHKSQQLNTGLETLVALFAKV